MDISAPGYDTKTGFGKIDAKAAFDYWQQHDFTRGIATNGSSVKIADNKQITLLHGPWGDEASGTYFADIYEVTFRVDLPSNTRSDVWFRAKDTYGWDNDGLNNQNQRRWSKATIDSVNNQAVFKTFVYDLDNIIDNIGWRPASPSNAQVAYTIASKPGSYDIPLSVSISGSQFLSSGQLGSWSANVSNAKGAVSYEWYYKKEDWSGYVLGGTSATFTHAFSTSEPDQSAVRVEVSSAGETAYDVHPVEVNGCVGGFDSQTISPDRKVPPCKVAPESEAVPETFSVESNYPNPFNPSTTIKFGLPEQAEVTLNVYNILGQNVATLLNETRSAGYYEVRFDASNLASGLYIGRLVANGESGKPFVKELKMQLVK